MNHAGRLTESELDAIYTHFCKTMTGIGSIRRKRRRSGPQSPLFLARFALLAMTQIGDSTVIQQLIDMAADKPDEA